MKKNIICIIGGGNMGEALVKGLINTYEVHVVESSVQRVQYLMGKYPEILMNGFESIKVSSVIVLAVKPQDMHAAFSWVSMDEFRQDKFFISIAAGLPTEYLEKHLKNDMFCPKPRVVRAMPNMPARINEGVTGICKGQYAIVEDLEKAEEILKVIGKTLRINEDMMDALTAVSGSGPGYVFLFVEEWIAAAMSLGFSEDDAKFLVLETLIGTANLIKNSNFTVRSLQDLRDERAKIASKGGTTEAAMNVFLNDNIFGQLIKKALEAAEERGKELAKRDE